MNSLTPAFSRLLHAVAFLLGICCARSLLHPEDWPLLYGGRNLFIPASAALEFLARKKSQPLLGVLMLLGLAWGSLRFQKLGKTSNLDVVSNSVEGQCLEILHASKGAYSIALKGWSQPIRLYSRAKGWESGAVYEFPSSCIRPLACKGHEPGAFCFARWSIDHGQGAVLYARHLQTVVSREPLPTLYRLRNALKMRLSARMSRRAQSWALALVLGDKGLFEQGELCKVQDLGLMHVLAISGLHVGLFFQVFKRVLLLLPLGLRAARGLELLLLLGVWAYALLCNLSPSVLRASLFISWFVVGRALLQRPTPGSLVWPMCLFVQLLLRPQDAFDMGFQLSYAATGALIYVLPAYQAWGRLANYILVVLVCSAMAFPILVFSTGHFSLGFWAGSLLLAPLLVGLIPVLWVGLFCPAWVWGFESYLLELFFKAWDALVSVVPVHWYLLKLTSAQALCLELLFAYFFWAIPKLFFNPKT